MYRRRTGEREREGARFEIPGNYSGSTFSGAPPMDVPDLARPGPDAREVRRPGRSENRGTLLPGTFLSLPEKSIVPHTENGGAAEWLPAKEADVPEADEGDGTSEAAGVIRAAEEAEAVPGNGAAGADAFGSARENPLRPLLSALGPEELLLAGLILLLGTEEERDNETLLALLAIMFL